MNVSTMGSSAALFCANRAGRHRAAASVNVSNVLFMALQSGYTVPVLGAKPEGTSLRPFTLQRGDHLPDALDTFQTVIQSGGAGKTGVASRVRPVFGAGHAGHIVFVKKLGTELHGSSPVFSWFR